MAQSHSSPGATGEEGATCSAGRRAPRRRRAREHAGWVTKDGRRRAYRYFWCSFMICVHPGVLTRKCRNTTQCSKSKWKPVAFVMSSPQAAPFPSPPPPGTLVLTNPSLVNSRWEKPHFLRKSSKHMFRYLSQALGSCDRLGGVLQVKEQKDQSRGKQTQLALLGGFSGPISKYANMWLKAEAGQPAPDRRMQMRGAMQSISGAAFTVVWESPKETTTTFKPVCVDLFCSATCSHFQAM